MPAVCVTAPAKIILLGEHAVVYGQPALAVPFRRLQAQVTVEAATARPDGEVYLDAPQVGMAARLADLPPDDPLAAAVRAVQQALGGGLRPACTVRITATIPLAAGLGSGAAVTVALVRALAAFWEHPLGAEQVNALAFEVEKLHHGTPSGIDNSVIAYDAPILFQRGAPLERLTLGADFTLVVGDTGVASPTRQAVAGVRARWQAHPAALEAHFAAIGELARAARRALAQGDAPTLGRLLDANQALLVELGVSSPELARLIAAAQAAGARGAKLSGGGQGGNMIALADSPAAGQAVAAALTAAGAAHTWITALAAEAP